MNWLQLLARLWWKGEGGGNGSSNSVAYVRHRADAGAPSLPVQHGRCRSRGFARTCSPRLPTSLLTLRRGVIALLAHVQPFDPVLLITGCGLDRRRPRAPALRRTASLPGACWAFVETRICVLHLRVLSLRSALARGYLLRADGDHRCRLDAGSARARRDGGADLLRFIVLPLISCWLLGATWLGLAGRSIPPNVGGINGHARRSRLSASWSRCRSESCSLLGPALEASADREIPVGDASSSSCAACR